MHTPWGTLEELNLDDRTLAEKILCADKHQLVEGMIVECLFDQFLDNLPKDLPGVVAIDVETVIAQTERPHNKRLAVVWARTKSAGLGRYLIALGKRFHVVLVEYDANRGFFGALMHGAKRVSSVKTLDELMQPFAAIGHTPFEVARSVRDENRQREAIWGFLFAHHGERLASKVLLPRILINCGIQPWFQYVWNLDRIFIVDGDPWLFEVKHKFPFLDRRSQALKFGLNDGELSIFRELLGCGIESLFSIMVKPKWSKEIGSLYMMTDLAARNRTAVISKVLDGETIRRLYAGVSGVSGAGTTITGVQDSKLKYKSLYASEFGMTGRFSEKPSEIAERIVGELRGLPRPLVKDEELYELKMSD
ncbi:hypothetical protein BLA6993_05477 [Burkholderia lata]|uniref:hypothetical protein n=1 Tax=Burkholderia lata (strain ATCC 17760 / DSM 23089 / LMG 22485 / NCIMB 9086 / R18194 / 383) TaxID=482957 RepID=UPI001453E894|nr:hypothetical protein [Burkholderia lata]VWC13683.1 hypothetical protein BLA6993_05477 [Burkholderia lata]